MANKMLIDATHPEETRVVVQRGNRVEEFDFESAQRKQLRGNIYLAKVTRVEPSLQAAFVDYGGNRHGFLAFSEIHPDYYQIPVADRQALIEEEERAQRAADAEADNRSSGRRPPRHRRAGRRDQVVRSEALPTDEPASESAETAVIDASYEPAADDMARDPAQSPESPAPAGDQAVQAAAHSDELPAAAENRDIAFGTAAGAEAEARDQHDDHHDHDHHDHGQHDHGHHDHGHDEHGHDEHSHDEHSHDEHGHDAGETRAAGEHDHADDEHDEHDEEEEIVESVGGSDALEEAQERTPRIRPRQYKIQEVIKRRQVMLVQVVKEERGTKGAALTTYLSLAGRYSVLMPNTARGGGISRKITQATDRKRLKEVAQDLEVPEGMGVILRTAGANRTKPEIKRDFEYLLRMWETVRDTTLKSTAPTLVYEEGSLIKRSIRDLYSKDIEEVVVAGEQGYQEAKDFMRMLMPSHAKNVKPYKDTQPVFSRMGIEGQLDAMFSPVVQLRSGGYIVINQTEALVAIDVNSGRATREHHIEDTALKTNLEASEEIARQLRLRDLAGLVVIDFIDMDEKRNNRSVERRLKECLKHDRARIQVGRISHFGLLEMSRQRIRTSVFESSTEKCPHCGGTGHQRSVSSLSLQVLRSLEETLIKGATHNLVVRTRSEVAIYVLNHKRAHLRALEERFRITITITADPTVGALQPFLIEKGEQVHTPEAAKAIAAAQPVNVIAFADAESEADEEFEDEFESEAEAEGTAPQAADDSGEADDADEAGETGETGETTEGDGRRRKRRRRRGRRAGSEGREPGAGTQETASEQVDEGDEQDEGEAAEAAPAGEGESNGEARDGRRRRRGRRGGRRSRQDREPGAAPEEAESAMPMQDRPAPVFEQPQPEFRPSDFEPRSMQPVEPAASESAASPPAEAPPPRRSTVREPAPVFGSEAPPPPPAAEAAPPAPPPEPEPSDDADRPRKTGWWRRRG